MVIQMDSREKPRATAQIIAEFEKQGIKFYTSKLLVGDYMSLDNPKVIVDRKQNLIEVCGNVCQQHERFRREIERANDCGIHLIFLVEHGRGIKTLEDVRKWQNPRLKVRPDALTGERLYRILKTMEEKYGVEFLFCDKRQTGKRIIELLGVKDD